MTSHDVSVAIYAGLALIALVIELIALSQPGRLASIGRTLGRAMRTRTGRLGIATGWVWLGLHFFGL
ncbi:MAG: hypothetical protein A2146_06845 [Actinobacteria bacterium RBG_16_67_10]|nr:MAG: hypothetical protein A2146_06845 [Actinobacteria bacterium RBG_16_67_10]